MTKPLPSIAQLRKALRYEPETGKLFWKPRPLSDFASDGAGKRWNKVHAYNEAGSLNHILGYIQVSLFDMKIYGHRAAWAIFSGSWPEHEIDHINGTKHDNRIENLRSVQKTINAKNKNRQSNNTSGEWGICWDKETMKWRVRVYDCGVQVCLGRFSSMDMAILARDAARDRHGYTDRHGVT